MANLFKNLLNSITGSKSSPNTSTQPPNDGSKRTHNITVSSPDQTSTTTSRASSSHPVSGLPVPNSSKSFWHSEPNEFLMGHRTAEDLPAEADIVIVGSGITGASVARYLSESEEWKGKGKKVVMLEAREACWGATGRNGGHCQPLLLSSPPPIAAFELRNVAALKSYIQTNSIPCEWRSLPGCRTFWSADLLASAEESLSALRASRPDMADLVTVLRDPEELRRERIGDGCVGATLTQGAASLWPYKLVTWTLEHLIRAGHLNLQTNTPVLDITPPMFTSPSSATSSEGYYREIIHTPRGTLKTHTLILCTNGYTSHLLPSFADLIVPVRGEMSALLPPKSSTRLPNSYGFLGSNGQSVQHDDYLVQRPFDGAQASGDDATDGVSGAGAGGGAGGGGGGGHLMFGGGRGSSTIPSVGEYDDSVIDTGAAAYLRRTILTSLRLDGSTSDLKELPATHQWTGIMGYSRDSTPWVGPVPGLPGVYMSAGYTGHGMPNASLCAKAVVEMLLAEERGEDLGEVKERLIEEGELPEGYFVEEERMGRARREWPTVEVADREGLLGWQGEGRVVGDGRGEVH